MFLDILLAAVMFGVGSVAFSFVGMQILIILFFGIPTTAKLKKEMGYQVHAGAIYRSMCVTILICGAVLAACVWGLLAWGNSWAIYGAAAGAAMALLTGIGKMGFNESNLTDYVRVYGKFMEPSVVESFYILFKQ